MAEDQVKMALALRAAAQANSRSEHLRELDERDLQRGMLSKARKQAEQGEDSRGYDAADFANIRSKLVQGVGGGSVKLNEQYFTGSPSTGGTSGGISGGSVKLNGQYFTGSQPGYGTPGASSLAALDAIEPLAKAGILDRKQVGALLTKEIGADFESQQQQSRMSRDINAMATQFRQGRISESSLRKGIGDLYTEYGANLYSNPNFAQLAGIEEQRKAAQVEAVKSFAANNELPANRVRWDEQQNRPVFDQNSAQIDMFKLRIANDAAKREHDAQQNIIKEREIKLKSVNGLMNSILNAPGAEDLQNLSPRKQQRLLELDKQHTQLLREGLAPVDAGPAPQPESKMSKTIPNASSFKSYGTFNDAVTALKTGVSRVGDTIMIGGVPHKVYPDGSVSPVR